MAHIMYMYCTVKVMVKVISITHLKEDPDVGCGGGGGGGEEDPDGGCGGRTVIFQGKVHVVIIN